MYLLILIILIQTLSVSAQGIAINTAGLTPDSSAILDVSSSSKGLLTPRMTSSQRTAIINPATGLLVFQTDSPSGFWYYDSIWVQLNTGGGGSPSSGAIELVYNDESTSTYNANSPGGTTILKSWVLPDNSYSKIIIEAEGGIRVGANGGGSNSGYVSILIGGISYRTAEFIRPVHDYESWTIPYSVKFVKTQQTSLNIEIQAQLNLGGATNGTITVKGFRVYGVN